ncbi:hypothetical protein E2C01_044751 [Portunus trituberculatus]|uniref:Uncharacterized protein n=1 Tax=Portunus trituberculatus TaxID=210409 RepID=A0A5B7G1C2_PORTR|nr:hypothetical protein [Portunus trituberculatus]
MPQINKKICNLLDRGVENGVPIVLAPFPICECRGVVGENSNNGILQHFHKVLEPQANRPRLSMRQAVALQASSADEARTNQSSRYWRMWKP